MSRIPNDRKEIMLTILEQVRKDFPNGQFMWKWHSGTVQYALYFREPQEGMDNWQFEDYLNDTYVQPKGLWNCTVFQGDVEHGVDIIEEEHIVNIIKHYTKK